MLLLVQHCSQHTASAAPLAALLCLTDGDKDTFRAAFYLAGSLPDFFQVEYPLGLMLQEKQVGAGILASAAMQPASRQRAGHAGAQPHPAGPSFLRAAAMPRLQGGFWNRGYLQPHPNGSAMFVHRVAAAKFEVGSDDPKPITHVTVPSCNYFGEKVGGPAGYAGK